MLNQRHPVDAIFKRRRSGQKVMRSTLELLNNLFLSAGQHYRRSP
jgi:hypothetical protein